MSYCFKILIYSGRNMHKNALFLLKNCKIAQLWGLRLQSPTNLSLPQIGKSWLRHCLSLCPKFLTPIAFHLLFWLGYNLAYLVTYVVAYAQAVVH